MKVRAAVVREYNKLAIETIELDAPQTGEVLVRVHTAGVCHSDLHTYRGEMPGKPPLVLGHEGAGVVVDVGAGVTRIKLDDLAQAFADMESGNVARGVIVMAE